MTDRLTIQNLKAKDLLNQQWRDRQVAGIYSIKLRELKIIIIQSSIH